MKDPNDKELLARLKAGDDTAIRDVAEAYGSKIYQLAFRYLRNKEDAEEIVQDVLFKVYRKVNDFRGDAADDGGIDSVLVAAEQRFAAQLQQNPPIDWRRHQTPDLKVRPGCSLGTSLKINGSASPAP